MTEEKNSTNKVYKINNSLNLQIKSKFGYTFGFSDTQRYKMMGNAVTTNVIKAIAEKLPKQKI